MVTEKEIVYDSLPPIGETEAEFEPTEHLHVSATPHIPSRSRLMQASTEDYGEFDFIPFGATIPSPQAQPLVLEPAAEEIDWPWIQARSSTGSVYQSPLLQLHQEILDFCKFISPTKEEEAERARAVERVSECIYALWPDCKVQVFGSYATGLYLPTSDVDMVILDSSCAVTQSGLVALSKVLRRRGVGHKIVVIGKARVPIVKFLESESGISFDVSFDLTNGPEAARYIQKQINTLPPLRPLCMVLKIFLQQRELNEVYAGGIGSYTLLTMIMAHLQLHPSRHSDDYLETNLGVLLVDFLHLYGRALNVKDVGVSCSNGGRFYSKLSRGFYDRNKPFLLSVEDPQAADNDIGKNSFKYDKVRNAFFLAHRLLTSPGTSLGVLGRIIRNDTKLTSRKHLSTGDPVPGYFFKEIDAVVEKKKPIEKKRKADDEQRKSRKQQKRENDYPKRRKVEEPQKKRKFEADVPEEWKRPSKQARRNAEVIDTSSSRPDSNSRPPSKWKKVEDADNSPGRRTHDSRVFGKSGQRSSVESTAFYSKFKYKEV